MHFLEAEDALRAESRIERLRLSVEDLFARLDEHEVPIVTQMATSAETLKVRWFAQILTRLGNGWLYPLLSLFLVAAGRVELPARFFATVAMNLLIAFTLYPLLKHGLARRRPCDYEPLLARDAAPLDHYSCPSGHTMTVVAFSVTVLFAWPEGAVLGVLLCLAMGWSRIALGHHYPTDVVLGGALGAAVATPVSAFVY